MSKVCILSQIASLVEVHVLMRDEKEERKKQARHVYVILFYLFFSTFACTPCPVYS